MCYGPQSVGLQWIWLLVWPRRDWKPSRCHRQVRNKLFDIEKGPVFLFTSVTLLYFYINVSRCCKAHDECYDRIIREGICSWDPKWVWYKISGSCYGCGKVYSNLNKGPLNLPFVKTKQTCTFLIHV